MAYSQFGYSFPNTGNSTTAISARTPQTSPTRPPTSCCETGRPIMTDPHTGQTICSCQYNAAVLSAALPRSTPLVAGTSPDAIYSAALASQGYMAGLHDPTQLLYNPLATMGQPVKDAAGAEAWRSSTGLNPFQTPGLYYPYDPTLLANYPYGYGMEYNGMAPRKNATKETTSTLKAWLNEHKKNPYPTKGEKIMLAIITKMTLTQVSTWFANARRRLKKENKMTWSPRNKTDDDEDGSDLEGDGDRLSLGDRSTPDPEENQRVNADVDTGTARDRVSLTGSSNIDRIQNGGGSSPVQKASDLPSDKSDNDSENEAGTSKQISNNCQERGKTPESPSKPKIWSLADTATEPNKTVNKPTNGIKIPSSSPGGPQSLMTPQSLSSWYQFGVHPGLTQAYALASNHTSSSASQLRPDMKHSQGRFMPYPQVHPGVHPAFSSVHPAFRSQFPAANVTLSSSSSPPVTSPSATSQMSGVTMRITQANISSSSGNLSENRARTSHGKSSLPLENHSSQSGENK